MRQPVRRLLSGILTLAAVALGGTVLAAPAAHAAPCTPWPSCFGGVYQVTGTPDNALSEWTTSPSLGGTVVRSVANGTSLVVGCQAGNGPQEDGKYNMNPSVPSRTWDFVYDNGLQRYVWVYDWWMNTPPQQQAYGWYSWPDASRHCDFATPDPPSAPTSVEATLISPQLVHVTWKRVSRADSYVVTSGTAVASTTATSFDWPVYATGTVLCFAVAAKNAYGQSPWSAVHTCTSTIDRLYCPQDDVGAQACTPAGAFQVSCWTVKGCSTPTEEPPDPGCCAAALAEAGLAKTAFLGAGWTHASDFLDYYLDATGVDRSFHSLDAYFASLDFAYQVDTEVWTWVRRVDGRSSTFDSGFQLYPPDSDLDRWGGDFHHALGRCYFRVSGTRSGTSWTVQLMITERYQFRDGQVFDAGVNGHDLRQLQIYGLAHSYRLIGTDTLTYAD